MYPLSVEKPWPVNQWYVAGFGSEVSTHLIARTFLNQQIILFRDREGAAHALSGICPHRMMPMVLGKLEVDRVACAYHGLEFDFNGRCVGAPTSGEPPACSLKRFPLREVGPLLWIWVGEPELARSTPLPPQEHAGVGVQGWKTERIDYGLLKARYTLLVDNLFDLTHIAFIHHSLFGESSNISMGRARIESGDGRLAVTRTTANVASDKQQRINHPDCGDVMTVDLTTQMIGISMIQAGAQRWDGPDKNAPDLGSQMFLHLVTPETETTCHYWIGMARNFRIDDEQFSEMWSRMTVAVVQQDRDALEAIERMIASGQPLPNEISMISDAGALRARARILQMIRDDDRGSTRPVTIAGEEDRGGSQPT